MQRIIFTFAAVGIALLGWGLVNGSGFALTQLSAASEATWLSPAASLGLKYKVSLVLGVCAPIALLGVVAGAQKCCEAFRARLGEVKQAPASLPKMTGLRMATLRQEESWARSLSV